MGLRWRQASPGAEIFLNENSGRRSLKCAHAESGWWAFVGWGKGSFGGGKFHLQVSPLHSGSSSRVGLWISLSEASAGVIGYVSGPVQSFSVHPRLLGQ